jgi:hypothetical protein
MLRQAPVELGDQRDVVLAGVAPGEESLEGPVVEPLPSKNEVRPRFVADPLSRTGGKRSRQCRGRSRQASALMARVQMPMAEAARGWEESQHGFVAALP